MDNTTNAIQHGISPDVASLSAEAPVAEAHAAESPATEIPVAAGEQARSQGTVSHDAQTPYDAVYQAFAREVTRIRDAHPQWFLERFEEVNPMIASEEAVMELIDEAPDAIVRAMLVGIMMQRSLLSAVTGRRYVRAYEDVSEEQLLEVDRADAEAFANDFAAGNQAAND